MMRGLGKAILAGSQAFTDQRDLLRQRKMQDQDMERQALQMALMNEQNDRQAREFILNQEKDNFELGHAMAGALPDGTPVSDAIGERFKDTPFFTQDPYYNPSDGPGVDDGGNPIPSLPDPQGRTWKSILPVDTKSALQNNKLATDLTRAQIQAYQLGLNRDNQYRMGQERNDTAIEVALIRALNQGNNQPNLEDLADAVEKNPEVMDQLGTSVKAKIIPMLAQRGFTQFGKPLSSTEVAYLAEQNNARSLLAELRKDVEANKRYLGPVTGMSALNPWSDARQVKARLDAGRQRIGKALEGGVLRKEDEEKYKYQLATLYDVPELALFKIDRMLEDFDRDVALRRAELRAAGRRVGPEVPPTTTPAQPPVGLVVGPDGKVRKQ